ncbi:MAG TPA: tRNA (adenosine(37)-N6)-dimethylallyltransferase MiaA [Opitutaceae bacterium]|nr:tRNA (adenosine(37)-N6)-dimethylallyltransferase MiaA [Opitutaceae bacterium]
MPDPLYILTGPTAVGKTAWALRWAETYGAEIVSCDSLLFYRGMDIGTAKPTADELKRVPHHLINVCDVRDRVNVTDYVRWAQQAVAGIVERGRRVLVVGGSGFYLGCFFGPVGDEVQVPEALRTQLRERFARDGLSPLVEELRQLNPLGLGDLDIANPRRVVRALERCLASQRTLKEMADAFAQLPGPFSAWPVRVTRLETEPEQLLHRIEQRVAEMLANGLVAEVERLLDQGLETNPSAARAIGYRETIDVIRGRTDRGQLAAQIVQNTRHLVKKQNTWFRTQLPPHHVMSSENGSLENLFPV